MEISLFFVTLCFLFVPTKAPPCGGTCPAANPCCDPISNQCVECCDDADCSAPNPFCETIHHMCVECLNDEHCLDMTGMPICNTGINQCERECNSSSTPCANANEVCNPSVGFCVCANDGDPCNGINEHCDASGNCVCDSGYHRNDINDCVRECVDDGDCQDNEECSADGYCVCIGTSTVCDDPRRTCNVDGECVCETGHVEDADGNCVRDCYDPVCTENQVCTRTQTCICKLGYVENENGECVRCVPECETDEDCRNDDEICGADNRCRCSAKKMLFHGKCIENGHLGGWCFPDGRCLGKRLTCDLPTNRCVCRGDCQAVTVCLKKRWPWK